MTKEDLELFFKERPSLSKAGVGKEADVSRALLEKILIDDRTLTPETAKKLLPVLRKYGYKGR